MISKILIVDPLTLLGREILRCLEDAHDLKPEVDYRHTSTDDEIQIAELAAAPALVAPLDDAVDLVGVDAVIIASDAETDRTRHLNKMMERHPEVAFIDAGRLPRLSHLTDPSTGFDAPTGESRHLRVAHPAVTATAIILRALRHADPARCTLAAVEPVSTSGRSAIEALAHQAARRLQGGMPEDLVAGHVLAFNQVAVDPDALADEAAVAVPGVPFAVTRTLAGCFHGHVVHLGINLAIPVDDAEIRDLLEERPEIVLSEAPLRLDDVADRDQVLVTLPQLSADRRMVAFTAMVDGLRIGGAVTALDIVRSMF